MSSTFDKCYFRPSLYFQLIKDWQAADAGLEFRMNFTTQQNEGKFPSSINLSETSLAKCRAEQLHIVPASAARPDGANLSPRLRNAATWNQPEDMEHLLRTCYVTSELALPAFVEAAKRNYLDIIKLLLQAGVKATDVDSMSGKSAIHVACENGQEDAARLLVLSASSTSNTSTKVDCAIQDAFQVARHNDLGFMARRLEALYKEQKSILELELELPQQQHSTPTEHEENKSIVSSSRCATIEDQSKIYKIVNIAYALEKGCSGIAFKKENKERFSSVTNVFNDEHPAESFIILEDSVTNAMVAVTCCIMKDTVTATFGPFAVALENQNQGYGSALLTAIERQCKEQLNASRIEIEVVNHRADLFPWYEKRGFSRTGQTRPFDDPSNHFSPSDSVVLSRPSHYVILEKKLL